MENNASGNRRVALQFFATDTAVLRHFSQRGGCGRLGARGRLHGARHITELPSGDARRVAGHDDGRVVSSRFLAALVIGRGEKRGGACCKGEGVDEAQHIRPEGLGCDSNAAEHVF